MRLFFLSLSFVFLLSGCSGASKYVKCPTVKTYTDAEEKQLATDLSENKISQEGTDVIIDYFDLRAELNACNKGS